MSIEAVHWALDVPVSGNAKVVLIGIANHAKPNGSSSYPSLDTLAEYAFCDRATVRRNLRKLEDDGWLERDGRGPRGQVCWRLLYGRKEPRRALRDPSNHCVYCGAFASGVDHVLARSKGGGEEANLVPACTHCNSNKGTRDVREWVEASGRDWLETEARLKQWGILPGSKMPPHATNGVANGVAFGVAPVPPEPTTNNQQGDKSPISVEKGDVVECFAYWQERCNHKTAKLGSDRRAKIEARLREGYTVHDIRRAIDGAARAPFVAVGGKRFDDIELICRNGSKLEDFMERADAKAQVVPITRAPHLERMDAWKRGYPAEGSA